MKTELTKNIPSTLAGEYRSPKTKVIEVELQRTILNDSGPNAGEIDKPIPGEEY